MIPGYLYQTVFLYTIIVLTILVASGVSGKSYRQLQNDHGNTVFVVIFCLVVALFLGMRPGGPWFGDSYLYRHAFDLMSIDAEISTRFAPDIVWRIFTNICAHTIDVSTYFTIIEFGYIGFILIACKKLVSNNTMILMLFMMGALSFYSYGVNGIRNGLACSIILCVIAFSAKDLKYTVILLPMALFAMGIHKTTVLPFVCLLVSVYIVRQFKWAYTFWIVSILISLVAGGAISSIIAGLGFDDRANTYIEVLDHSEMFSHTGFRWDFLIYSMMPIVLGYYVVIKRGIQDRTYTILLNTYTLANAFWVMVIRASYSNRFAYLSWFMYPLVLAYPLLKLDIWGDEQGKRLSQIMLAHVGFTWFMETFYWG